MAKRLKTYRVDGDLDDAAAAKAARIGRTMTDVIVRAIEEFVKDGPAPVQSRNMVTPRRAQVPPVSTALPTAPPAGRGQAAPERVEEVRASELEAPEARPKGKCKHSSMRVRKGPCPDCGEWVTRKS